MQQIRFQSGLLRLALLVFPTAFLPASPEQAVPGEAQPVFELTDFAIKDQQMANLRPVGTFANPVSNLDFEPRVDLQARNMAEAQGDVTIRGGIFENTGFRIGSATLIDPQTGHYFAELPLAPEMLERPDVLTGAENALLGFNSTVGTLSYALTEIEAGGSATAGFGDHDLNFQRLYQAQTGQVGPSGDWTWGAEAEISRSESDGTRAFSDHDFFRTTARFQLSGPRSQTDLFAGYQSKFFGQFGMYTGDTYTAFDPFETENLKTRLFLLNHRQTYGDESFVEATAYFRRHSDHYIFNRFDPDRRFVHETKVSALGLSGQHRLSDRWRLNYAGQITADAIDSSNLEEQFTSRTLTKLSLLPEYRLPAGDGATWVLRGGLSLDESNRDEAYLAPIFELAWQRQDSGRSDRVYLSYTESSQVAGYTAIGGPTGTGLFRSNPDLDREVSRNLELGFTTDRGDWSVDAAVFYRWDRDLVDWTFDSLAPFTARSASQVDIDTLGFELIGARRWQSLEAIASYTYLHKDEDYRDPGIIGSFYALNFPEHRATLGLIWELSPVLELRLDNELRIQEANPLRSGPDEAVFTHLGMSYFPAALTGLELFAAWEKPWDESFQEVPGTPGRGDQVSAGATYRW